MSCCDPRGCDKFFSPRFARRVAQAVSQTWRRQDRAAHDRVPRAARHRGCDRTRGRRRRRRDPARTAQARCARSVSLELSSAYDEEARELLREARLEGRADRRIRDIADGEDGIEPADVVVLHRVVCCYPDYERLLTAVAAHAPRLVVFSYPRRNAISRLVVAAQNLSFRLLRREFRTFAHPPAAMLNVLTNADFVRASTTTGSSGRWPGSSDSETSTPAPAPPADLPQLDRSSPPTSGATGGQQIRPKRAEMLISVRLRFELFEQGFSSPAEAHRNAGANS